MQGVGAAPPKQMVWMAPLPASECQGVDVTEIAASLRCAAGWPRGLAHVLRRLVVQCDCQPPLQLLRLATPQRDAEALQQLRPRCEQRLEIE